MNEYLSIILGVVLIYQAVMAISGSDTYTRKLKGKYTPESLTTYSKVTGAGTIVAAVVFIFAGLNQLGFINIGLDFNDKSVVLTVYGVVLVVLIVLLVAARVAILKPLDGVSGGKKKNIEDEDY